MRRTQREHVRVHHLAETRLNPGGRTVGDHGPGVVESAPEADRQRHQSHGPDQGRQGNPGQDSPEKPAQESQSRDPGRYRQETQQHRRDDSGPDPRREGPELPI